MIVMDWSGSVACSVQRL